MSFLSSLLPVTVDLAMHTCRLSLYSRPLASALDLCSSMLAEYSCWLARPGRAAGLQWSIGQQTVWPENGCHSAANCFISMEGSQASNGRPDRRWSGLTSAGSTSSPLPGKSCWHSEVALFTRRCVGKETFGKAAGVSTPSMEVEDGWPGTVALSDLGLACHAGHPPQRRPEPCCRRHPLSSAGSMSCCCS